jgi:hypothetical protein
MPEADRTRGGLSYLKLTILEGIAFNLLIFGLLTIWQGIGAVFFYLIFIRQPSASLSMSPQLIWPFSFTLLLPLIHGWLIVSKYKETIRKTAVSGVMLGLVVFSVHLLFPFAYFILDVIVVGGYGGHNPFSTLILLLIVSFIFVSVCTLAYAVLAALGGLIAKKAYGRVVFPVIILLLLALTALIYSSYSTGDCSVITDPDNRNECYFTAAKNTGDPIHCGKIESTARKTTCYQSMAIKQSNTSICNAVEDEMMKSDCIAYAKCGDSGSYSVCRIKVYRETLNPNYCDKYENGRRDNCIGQIIVRVNNKTLCDMMSTQTQKDQCYIIS